MIGIVDYGLGNLASVAGAVEKLGFDPVISTNAEVLGRAEKLILPGVGAFGDGMRKLVERGLVAPLTRLVCEDHRPILGICLGFQLFAEESEEFGCHAGLGWLPARVRRLAPQDPTVRIPHVGWNGLLQQRDTILFAELEPDSVFYYVHSYVLESRDPELVIGACDYGETFASVIQSGNIYGTQFHPEKSQRAGLKLLGNFLEKA
jgi:imidazole glycerol-phosphate synthase subunit HisH